MNNFSNYAGEVYYALYWIQMFGPKLKKLRVIFILLKLLDEV